MLSFTGLARLRLFMSLSQRAAENFGEAWVGSAVEYGPYQEFGTRTITERPHWRVAIPEVVNEIAGSQVEQGRVLDGMLANVSGASNAPVATVDSGGTAPMIVAQKIERKVKRIITAKRIIDTGNYRASVASGRTESQAYAKSEARSSK